MTWRTILVGALIAASLSGGLSACGGPTYHGEAARVDTALKAYDRADRANRSRAVCERSYSPHYARAFAGSVGACISVLRRDQPLGLTSVKHLEVDGHRASADIHTRDKSKGSVQLVERHGRWLIDGFEFTSLGD